VEADTDQALLGDGNLKNQEVRMSSESQDSKKRRIIKKKKKKVQEPVIFEEHSIREEDTSIDIKSN